MKRYRLVLGVFILGLVLSGVTAFPLAREMDLLVSVLGLDRNSAGFGGLGFWIRTVHDGLEEVYAAHPWVAYGSLRLTKRLEDLQRVAGP